MHELVLVFCWTQKLHLEYRQVILNALQVKMVYNFFDDILLTIIGEAFSKRQNS